MNRVSFSVSLYIFIFVSSLQRWQQPPCTGILNTKPCCWKRGCWRQKEMHMATWMIPCPVLAGVSWRSVQAMDRPLRPMKSPSFWQDTSKVSSLHSKCQECAATALFYGFLMTHIEHWTEWDCVRDKEKTLQSLMDFDISQLHFHLKLKTLLLLLLFCQCLYFVFTDRWWITTPTCCLSLSMTQKPLTLFRRSWSKWLLFSL